MDECGFNREKNLDKNTQTVLQKQFILNWSNNILKTTDSMRLSRSGCNKDNRAPALKHTISMNDFHLTYCTPDFYIYFDFLCVCLEGI